MSLFQVTKKQVIENYELRTMTGDIVSFTPSYSQLLPDPFSDLNVAVNIVATGGNGTPDNPIPINGYTAVNLTNMTGKNLAYLEQGSIDISTGVETPSTTRVRTQFIRVQPNTYYIASSENNDWSIRNGVLYGANKQYLRGGVYPNAQGLIATPSDAVWLRLIYSHVNTSETCEPDDYWYQFEEGNTATSYEPYQGVTYAIALGDTYYGGTLDVTRGVLTVTSVKDTFDLSNYTPTTASGYDSYLLTLTQTAINDAGSSTGKLCNLCDRYAWSGSSVGYEHYYITDSLAVIYLDENTQRTSTVEFVYPLATPIVIDLGSGTAVTARAGVNNVFADCGETTVTCLI